MAHVDQSYLLWFNLTRNNLVFPFVCIHYHILPCSRTKENNKLYSTKSKIEPQHMHSD